MAEKSKVYFTSYRTTQNMGVIDKFRKVILEAGFDQIDFKDKLVAIKMHFGELGNMAYTRPNYARALAEMIKERGGRPFVTDTCTLYNGQRTNAWEYLQGASQNGYNMLTVGCPVIIADGLRGIDEVTVPLGEPCTYLKEAHIASALMQADFVVSLSHFKGHGMGGFGGTIKNLGMGSGSRAGKMSMHCSFPPTYIFDQLCKENCGQVGRCALLCEAGAISVGEDGRCKFDTEKCTGCNKCIGFCNYNAIATDCMRNADSPEALGSKMAEYTYAVCHDRQEFHVNLIVDVSPSCDCAAVNDVPVVPNIGMLASFDPVAIDKASLDLVNEAPVMVNSQLAEALGCDHIHEEHDVFHALHPKAAYDWQLIHGKEIGLGTDEYELIEV